MDIYVWLEIALEKVKFREISKLKYIIIIIIIKYIFKECYVADEIITARSGKRVRVGNTDAEGRMVMVDLLNEAKDSALKEKNPQLFTIATLTGHVIRAYGPDYSVNESAFKILFL